MAEKIYLGVEPRVCGRWQHHHEDVAGEHRGLRQYVAGGGLAICVYYPSLCDQDQFCRRIHSRSKYVFYRTHSDGWGKVMFSQVYLRPQGREGDTPAHWSVVSHPCVTTS